MHASTQAQAHPPVTYLAILSLIQDKQTPEMSQFYDQPSHTGTLYGKPYITLHNMLFVL